MKKIIAVSLIIVCSLQGSVDTGLEEAIRASNVNQVKQLLPSLLTGSDKARLTEFAKSITSWRKEQLAPNASASCERETSLMSHMSVTLPIMLTGCVLAIYGIKRMAGAWGNKTLWTVHMPPAQTPSEPSVTQPPVHTTTTPSETPSAAQPSLQAPSTNSETATFNNFSDSLRYIRQSEIKDTYNIERKSQGHFDLKSLTYLLLSLGGIIMFSLPIDINFSHIFAHKKHVTKEYFDALMIEQLIATVPEQL